MIDISDHPEIIRLTDHFLEISKIPRGSGNTAAIADFLYNFGKNLGLESYRDEFDNVVIKKPAAKGYEDRPTVVIQGHSDIVAEKEPSCDKDMTKEGVEVYRGGDYLRARGTTLGADDGVAIAYAMALLESTDIPHPALECVFTSDEETGLKGATNISPELISGRMMINLDSGDEGIFTVGCAGGMRADITLPLTREDFSGEYYKLSLEGLLGGHSGVEIDKGRINALKVMAKLISSIPDAAVARLWGGNADNAIPREAYAVIAVNSAPDFAALEKLTKELTDPEEGSLTAKKTDFSGKVLTRSATKKLLSLLTDIPTGVYKMSLDIEGLVETSLNVAVADTAEEEFSLTVSIRSSKNEEKHKLYKKVEDIALGIGASVSGRGDYPGWDYKKDSKLREVMERSYEQMYGKTAQVVMIHAGLECGIFSDKLPGLDCVSTGPNHFDIHTPKEHLSLSSFERVWKFLLSVLKNI